MNQSLLLSQRDITAMPVRLVIVTQSQLYDCKNAETHKRKVFILEAVLN